jgi:thiol-disulfide isomerase/thioredoxin
MNKATYRISTYAAVVVLITMAIAWSFDEDPAPDLPDTNTSSRRDNRYDGDVLAGKDMLLLEFRKSDFDQAMASNTPILLYFYANWCPECKEETMNALYPVFDRLMTDAGALDIIGFRVNYKDSDTDDDETELARTYGIAYQHTKVMIKNEMEQLKAPDSWNLDRYMREIDILRIK